MNLKTVNISGIYTPRQLEFHPSGTGKNFFLYFFHFFSGNFFIFTYVLFYIYINIFCNILIIFCILLTKKIFFLY